MWNFYTKAEIIVGTVKLREGSLTALLSEQILALLLLWCPSWQDIYRFGHQPDGGVPGDDLLLQPEGKIRASHASENDSWCWGMLSCCGLTSLFSRVTQLWHRHCNEYDKTFRQRFYVHVSQIQHGDNLIKSMFSKDPFLLLQNWIHITVLMSKLMNHRQNYLCCAS